MERLILSKRKQFAIVFFTFVLLGLCFKVMVLVEGFTEVRPVNAVPMPAGLFFGTVGSFACAVANLVSDALGNTLGMSSSLGFLANFIAAYLPYKLWYIYREEEPNVHTLANLALFFWIDFVAALPVSWMIAGGLWLIMGLHIENLALYIFLNDFVFTIIFGLPVFIVLTSDSVKLVCSPGNRSLLPVSRKLRRRLTALYALLLVPLCLMIWGGDPAHAGLCVLLSVPAIILSFALML